MPVQRHLPTEEATELLALTRELVREELAPRAAQDEADSRFPREVFRTLGKAGLLGLPYPEEHGGGGQPYEVYLQVVEELATVWATVAEGVSVHTLACFPLAEFGTDEQRARWLPDLVGGELLGGYCLSEAQSGSDAAAMITRAVRDGDEWVVTGTKNWITNLGVADFYVVFCVTDPDAGHSRGISAFVVEADRPGFSVGKLEHKMGIRGSPTGQPIFDEVRVPAENLIGSENEGFKVAMSTLDRSRLGVAAQAVGIAQGATDYAASYAQERHQFGKPIAAFQGIQFKLADMESRTAAARELLYRACAKVDAGERDMGKYSSMAKLFASDTAMWVTTEAVQVLGGYGYVSEYPVERMMRDAKITQIYEGTNEIQRLVIARTLS
jgi:alkylation response protein AidB-like acyl-CoA dehydrogenase